jgi:uncharacterized protein YdeI (YjbR/CyaY-like superfamily)
MPVDLASAIPMAHAADFVAWLAEHGNRDREVVVAIYNKESGRQTVTLVELQEMALCHAWVDTQTRRIDTDRYAVRFVPRRPGSHWSPKNRAMARRMLDSGRMTAAGVASLPADM